MTPQTKNNRLDTCIAVVCTGLLTHPSQACNTSNTAALCTKAVAGPTAEYAVVALLSTGTRYGTSAWGTYDASAGVRGLR